MRFLEMREIERDFSHLCSYLSSLLSSLLLSLISSLISHLSSLISPLSSLISIYLISPIKGSTAAKNAPDLIFVSVSSLSGCDS